MLHFFRRDNAGGPSIRMHIRLYSLLLELIPIAIVVLFSIFLLRGMVLDRERGRLEQHVAYQKRFIENWLQSLQRDVTVIARDPDVRGNDEVGMRDLFGRYLSQHDDVFSVVRVAGDGHTTIDTSSPSGLDLGDRAYFNAAKEGDRWVSDVLIGRPHGRPIMVFSHPVTSMDRRFGGAVLLPVEMSTVQTFLNTFSEMDRGESYLVGRSGEMLTESSYLGLLKKRGFAGESVVKNLKIDTPLLMAAQRGEVLQDVYTGYHGMEVIGAYAWVNGNRWLLVAEEPLDDVLRDFYTLKWLFAAICIGTFILLLPVLIRFSRSIEEPLKGLADFAKGISRGEYEKQCALPDVKNAPIEVRVLYDTFCEMSERVATTIEELEHASHTDLLTGVYNRRNLMKEGGRVVEQCIRGNVPCAFLMMDIDHFKTVNDTYGHVTGDEVLAKVAAAIMQAVRTTDIVARYGGEEFAIIAPNSDKQQGALLAERIRSSVASLQFSSGGVDFSCTMSVGICGLQDGGVCGVTALECALNCADQQLYKAKKGGRNRVECCDDC
ncbi:sensor domain-containing diguanylate cyclase [Desulfovibrio mangrovi]|uniref:sensor domain-containing diguanylate cyclase n=1 Tax=Desulfovibrio mangrovi TaxID=2976983 RepID=UPI00224690DA|nr:sensor domain-containing diguanylate cyclase [Desulfovibrio mangrovi]UZP65999.1 sensor domain-containing diguanylate cyclase [Desulfovibrio mangrovi]